MRFSIFLLGASVALAAALGRVSAESASQWREEPKTPAAATWLARHIVAAQANNQPEIARGLIELLRAGGIATPCAQDGSFFFTKREPDEKQASIYRREGWEGRDERLLDGAKINAGKSAALTIFDVAPDGSRLVYGRGDGKTAEQTVHIFEVESGHDLPDTLPRARYHTVSLSPDKKGLWYTKVEPAGTKIFFHTFGGAPKDDKLVFGESYFYEPLGPKELISTRVAAGGEHLLIFVRRTNEKKRVDVYAQELEKPDERIRPIIHAMDNDFSVANHEGDLFVLTDNEAPKKRVVKIVIDDPHPLQWKVIVPEGDDLLSEIELIDETLFVSATHGDSIQTRIFTLEGQETGQIVMPKAEFAQRVWDSCPAD